MNTLLLLILILSLIKGVMYLINVKTFEMGKIPNSIIFFATRTSSIITGAYYCYMSIFIILLLFLDLDLMSFAKIFFIPFIFINALYGLAWIVNYLFVKKRAIICLLGIMHLLSLVLTVFYLVKVINHGVELKPFEIPQLFWTTIESQIVSICVILIVPLVVWHLIAPFVMNWKMWLVEREFNVLTESFIIFFVTAFTLSHPLLNVYYKFLYKHECQSCYTIFLALFIIFAAVEISIWLTYSHQTKYFKTFKHKLLSVMLPLLSLCITLLAINIMQIKGFIQ